MAKYILCPACNKKWANSAKKYDELFESIEGVAKYDMFCDGGCGVNEATPIKKGETAFAAVLLTNKTHPNYQGQKPETWGSELLNI